MAKSAEQQVLEALRADLEAVTVANGFNFDVEAVLFYSETNDSLGVDRSITVESLGSQTLDGRSQPTGKQAKRLNVDLWIAMNGHYDDATEEEKLGEALADIEKRLLEPPFLGGASTLVRIGDTERVHTPSDDPRSAARMQVSIDYRHDYGDPYALST